MPNPASGSIAEDSIAAIPTPITEWPVSNIEIRPPDRVIYPKICVSVAYPVICRTVAYSRIYGRAVWPGGVAVE